MHRLSRAVGFAVVLLTLVALGVPACANLMGLNQIPTPDIQPPGELCALVQHVNPVVDNSEQIELEIGLGKRVGFALYRCFNPGDTIANAQVGLTDPEGPFLASVGFLGLENNIKSNPFVEAGYYIGDWYLVSGLQMQDSTYTGLFGVSWARSGSEIMLDYISGPGNFMALGITQDLTPSIQFNPAIYMTNAKPHRYYGYFSLIWNVKVW